MLYLIIIMFLILYILVMLWIVFKEFLFLILDVLIVEDLLFGEGYIGVMDKIKWLKMNFVIFKEKIE